MNANDLLIARFMGGKTHKDSRLKLSPQEIWLPNHGICTLRSDRGGGKRLRYSTSWDWLIPVVKKILEMDGTKLGWYDHIDSIDFSLLELDIDAVYRAVVTFIKFIN